MMETGSAKREANIYKALDHQENLKKVQRVQSAYRQKLAEKIMDKSMRGQEVIERRTKL
jgi:hypothetical protein